MRTDIDAVEELLRRTLHERAADVDSQPVPSHPRPPLRRSRWPMIAALAAAVALFIVGAAVLSHEPRSDTHVTTRPPVEPSTGQTTTTTPTPDGEGSAVIPSIGIPGVRVVYGDRAYERTHPVGPSVDLGGVVSPDYNPIETPYGLVALVGPTYDHQELRVRPLDGSMTRLLTSDAAGFAVDADGRHVAWATALRSGTSTVFREVDLATGAVTATTTVDQFGRVGGYVGDRLLVTVGDGLANVQVWSPSQNSVQPINDTTGSTWGHVLGTDAGHRRAVLTQGDGLCAQVVELETRATEIRVLMDLPGCETRGPARFTGDGRWLAVNAGTFDDPVLTIYDLTGTTEPFATPLTVVDDAWTTKGTGDAPGQDGPPQLLVIPTGSEPILHTCRPDLRSCTRLDRLPNPPPDALISRL